MPGSMIQKLMVHAGLMTLAAALASQPVLADNDRDPTIREVIVNFDDLNGNTLTIKGENLVDKKGRYNTKVIIGERGALKIIGNPSDSQIVVECFVDNSGVYPSLPDFECNDGDYKLLVLIVQPNKQAFGPYCSAQQERH